jgi:hypothetical protein
MKHLELVKKHFPIRFSEKEPNRLALKFAEIAKLADLEDQDIAEFCEALSDEFDSQFRNGQDSMNLY